MDGELSLPLDEFYVSCTFYVYPCSKHINHYISGKHSASDASQTTPVQIYIFLCCVILHKQPVCNSDFY